MRRGHMTMAVLAALATAGFQAQALGEAIPLKKHSESVPPPRLRANKSNPSSANGGHRGKGKANHRAAMKRRNVKRHRAAMKGA